MTEYWPHGSRVRYANELIKYAKMLYFQNGNTYTGDVYAKVAGNVETYHVIQYWLQGSRVRYPNELIKYAEMLYLQTVTLTQVMSVQKLQEKSRQIM